MAQQIWIKRPELRTPEVSRKIQHSPAGKKGESFGLTYTVTYISKIIGSVRRAQVRKSRDRLVASPQVHAIWNRLEIPASPNARSTANTLIGMFRTAYHDAKSPQGAAVYHLESERGDHFFYLCPDASSICKTVLRDFPALSTEPPMHLEVFTNVLSSG